jgi:hypothetical protein
MTVSSLAVGTAGPAGPAGPQGPQGPAGSGGAATIPGYYTLQGDVSAGANQIELDRTPESVLQFGVGQGLLVLDPGLPICETIPVSSAADGVLTLPDRASMTQTRFHFDSARKVIELGVRIANISGSGSLVTVQTSRAHHLTTGDQVGISGTTAYNTFSAPSLAAVTVTVVDSTHFTYPGTETGTETAGSVVEKALWALMVQFFDTAAIVVSGSASNDGVYTVSKSGRDGPDQNAIVVNESLVEEDANGTSVTIKQRLNLDHSDGATVFWLPFNRVPLYFYGFKFSGNTSDAAANRLALQRALDDSALGGKFIIEPGTSVQAAYIDKPVYQEEQVALMNPAGCVACPIKAAPTFPASPDIFMCHARLSGRPVYPSNPNNPLVRTMQRGINWNGASVASLGGGLCLCSEQPAEIIDDVRCQNFTSGYGMAIYNTQQLDVGRLMVINNYRNLGLFGCEHLFITSFDSETPGSFDTGGCHVYMDSSPYNSIENSNLRIAGGHMEDTGVKTVGFWIKHGHGISYRGFHSLAPGSTHMHAEKGAGHSGAATRYDNDVTFSGSPTAAFAEVNLDQLVATYGGTGTWTQGSGAPSGSATTGDLYMDTATGNLYQSTGGTSWSLVGQIPFAQVIVNVRDRRVTTNEDSLPSGGTSGQVLTKQSSNPRDVAYATPAAAAEGAVLAIARTEDSAPRTETVTNADDDQLVLTLDADSYYLIVARLNFFSDNAVMNAKAGFNLSGCPGATEYMGADGTPATNLGGYGAVGVSSDVLRPLLTVGGDVQVGSGAAMAWGLGLSATIYSGSGGPIAVEWAQQTLNAGNLILLDKSAFTAIKCAVPS